jgi:hypothetical protein
MQRGRRDAGGEAKVERPDHRLWSVDVWLVAMWPLARLEHASCGLRSGQWACVGSFKIHMMCAFREHCLFPVS